CEAPREPERHAQELGHRQEGEHAPARGRLARPHGAWPNLRLRRRSHRRSAPYCTATFPPAAAPATCRAIIRTSSALVNGCHPWGFMGRPYSKTALGFGLVRPL